MEKARIAIKNDNLIFRLISTLTVHQVLTVTRPHSLTYSLTHLYNGFQDGGKVRDGGLFNFGFQRLDVRRILV